MEKLQSLRATYLSRKIASKCEYCAKDFGITRLRHLCKRCNRIICASCGSTRRTVVTFDLKTTHKVCPICERENFFQTTFMNSYQTGWGKLSTIGQLWREKCINKEENTNSKEETYAELLEVAEKMDEGDQDLIIIEKDVLSGRSDREVFNYSMQEFLYYNQEGIPLKDIQAKIARVLKAFCIRHRSIGYCQGMNYIACFLLSIMDEESAFIVLNHVVTKLLPQNYYTQTTQGSSLMGFHQEKFVLYSLAKERLNLDENTAEKVKLFLDINGPSFLIPMFVNYLNFQVLFMVWNEMIMKESINEMRRLALYMIEMLIDRIRNDTLEKSADLANTLINMFTVEKFQESQKIEINHEEVMQLEDEFKKTYSSKWVSQDAYVYHTLQKHTHFKKDEIKLLQEQYTKFVEGNQQQDKNIDGVNEQQLKEIVFLTSAGDEKKQQYLESLDFKNLFKIFDIDGTGYLDFKEFLSCLSMLTRGNLLERTEAAFQIFDKDEKGYLTSEEYNGFVKSIMEASKGMLIDQNELIEEDVQKFGEKLLEISIRKNRVQYVDIKSALFSDDFVELCDNADHNRVRGATIAHIQKSLSAASPKVNGGPINEENEEEC